MNAKKQPREMLGILSKICQSKKLFVNYRANTTILGIHEKFRHFIIVINRYLVHGGKITKAIKIPEVLDLSQYLEQQWFPYNSIYDLKGLIMHHGGDGWQGKKEILL